LPVTSVCPLRPPPRPRLGMPPAGGGIDFLGAKEDLGREGALLAEAEAEWQATVEAAQPTATRNPPLQ